MTKIINGYDKSKWGDTIEETLKLYEELGEISNEDGIKIGLRSLGRQRTGGVDEFQAFDFYNNKLYSVSLYFHDMDYASQEMLINKFIDKYGETNNIKEDKQNIDNETFFINRYCTYFISDEMTINLTLSIKMHKFTKEELEHNLRYHYYNPKIMIEISQVKARLDTNDIIV